MNEQFEIYLRDLNPDKQKEFLEFHKIASEKEGNFDVVPIIVIEK